MKKIKAHIESDEVYINRVSREDVFKMMTQEEHDEYTRELEDKVEAHEQEYITMKVQKGDYNSLMQEMLKQFRELGYNVKVSEQITNKGV